MIKIGIVGMGGMGWFHASRYFQIPGARLAAIADIHPGRLEARLPIELNIQNQATIPDLSGIQRYPDARHLIAEADVDVVDVCLPSYLHAQYAIEALNAGKHVLCEKPMALSLVDADQMIDSANKSGRKLMIAHCIRFWPEYHLLKDMISQGTCGRLLSLNLERIGGKPIGWGWNNWFLDPALSGGSMFDLHIHDVDFVNYLLSSPTTIQVSSRSAVPGSACDVIHALYQYADGPQVSIHAGWSEVQIPFKAGYEAWFEKAFVRYDAEKKPTLQVYSDPQKVISQPLLYTSGDAYLAEICYFLDCVEKDAPLAECTPESTRGSIALVSQEIQLLKGNVK